MPHGLIIPVQGELTGRQAMSPTVAQLGRAMLGSEPEAG